MQEIRGRTTLTPVLLPFIPVLGDDLQFWRVLMRKEHYREKGREKGAGPYWLGLGGVSKPPPPQASWMREVESRK